MSGTLAEGRGDLGVRLAPAAVAVGEVSHSEDAGQQRDGLALQPLKVAGAVVIFAVIPHGLGHPVYDLEFLNDAAAPLYIGLVELVLLLGDVPLQYHIIGQAHGAYFVQQARIVAVPAGGLIQPHPAGHLLRQLRSLLAVEVDLGDLGAEGAVHGRDDLQRHLREFALLRVDALLQ